MCELDIKYKWACRVLLQEHFPPLSKPGGVWMTLVDASGKEWSFEFCFWHSKESRIYYFKKFYPYVQATDLRGGDTGTYITVCLLSFLFLRESSFSLENLNKSDYDCFLTLELYIDLIMPNIMTWLDFVFPVPMSVLHLLRYGCIYLQVIL